MLALELLQSGKSIAGTHGGRSAAHHDGNAERLEHLGTASARREHIMNVKRDARIATNGDCYTKGNKFLGFGIERSFGGRCLMQIGKTCPLGREAHVRGVPSSPAVHCGARDNLSSLGDLLCSKLAEPPRY